MNSRTIESFPAVLASRFVLILCQLPRLVLQLHRRIWFEAKTHETSLRMKTFILRAGTEKPSVKILNNDVCDPVAVCAHLSARL